jgi:putative transposase
VGEVAQTLMGVAPSASTISRLNQTLTQQFDAWRERSLQDHWRILYLDGVHFSIRHGEKADATIILTALAVDLAGNKEVLARRSCAEESKEGWLSLLQDLRTRGVTQIDLIVTDGHDGLLAAVAELFAATPRQRCLVHKQRNILNAIPRRERGDVQAELVGIWEQPNKQEAIAQLAAFTAKYSKRYPEAVRSLREDEAHLLTFYQFPAAIHRYIQSSNAIESLFSNVRQRTDQIDVLYFGNQLPGHRLGHHAGYPFAQNLAGVSRALGSLRPEKATSRNGWFGQRCFCAGAAATPSNSFPTSLAWSGETVRILWDVWSFCQMM